MKIGVISDTHGYFDPGLAEHFAGVDAILHAGDVGSREVLDELELLAPIHAVRGNVDWENSGLPPSRTLQFENVKLALLHALPVPQTELAAWADGKPLGKLHPDRREDFLESFGQGVRVVVFGHSHQPCLLTLSHTLFFNPGSAGKKRFTLPRTCGVLEIYPRGLRGSIINLESSSEAMPEKVWLPLGE